MLVVNTATPLQSQKTARFSKIAYYCVNLINLTLKANLLNEVCFCGGFMCLLWIAQVHWKPFYWPGDTRHLSTWNGLHLVDLYCGPEYCRLVFATGIWPHLSSLGRSLSVLKIPGICSGDTLEWFLKHCM